MRACDREKEIQKNAQSFNISDFIFDSDLIDGQPVMGNSMSLCVAEPCAAGLLFMVDSPTRSVVEEGLKYGQHERIVNSISLIRDEVVKP